MKVLWDKALQPSVTRLSTEAKFAVMVAFEPTTKEETNDHPIFAQDTLLALNARNCLTDLRMVLFLLLLSSIK